MKAHSKIISFKKRNKTSIIETNYAVKRNHVQILPILKLEVGCSFLYRVGLKRINSLNMIGGWVVRNSCFFCSYPHCPQDFFLIKSHLFYSHGHLPPPIPWIIISVFNTFRSFINFSP